jgi:hypothetical protein
MLSDGRSGERAGKHALIALGDLSLALLAVAERPDADRVIGKEGCSKRPIAAVPGGRKGSTSLKIASSSAVVTCLELPPRRVS